LPGTRTPGLETPRTPAHPRQPLTPSPPLPLPFPLQAERLLSTSYFEHVHDASGAVAHRVTSGYSLPPDVAAAVDFACPTTHLPATAGPTVAGLTPKPSASMPSLASPHAGAASLPSKAGKAVAPSGGAAGLLGSHNTPKTLRQLYSVGSAQARMHTPRGRPWLTGSPPHSATRACVDSPAQGSTLLSKACPSSPNIGCHATRIPLSSPVLHVAITQILSLLRPCSGHRPCPAARSPLTS
jgi:hypothetical protein